MAYGTPNLQTHQQWLGLVQPVGLVVAPAVLVEMGDQQALVMVEQVFNFHQHSEIHSHL